MPQPERTSLTICTADVDALPTRPIPHPAVTFNVTKALPLGNAIPIPEPAFNSLSALKSPLIAPTIYSALDGASSLTEQPVVT